MQGFALIAIHGTVLPFTMNVDLNISSLQVPSTCLKSTREPGADQLERTLPPCVAGSTGQEGHSTCPLAAGPVS